MRTIALVVPCLLAASLVCAAPNATAVRLDAPPKLDGQLTEPVWQSPAPIRDFVILNSPEPARNQTEAWLAFDTDTLYVAVKAHDTEMGKLRATITERDGKLFSDDVIEVFLDVAHDRFHFVQLAFNPLGTQWDGAGDAAGWLPDWDGLWTVKTARGADFWSAEVAIPYAALGLSAASGPVWGFNLCRERPADGELSCWSQTGSRFGVPSAFGEIDVAADFGPFDLELTVTDWGQGVLGSNSLRAVVGNPSATPRELTWAVAVTSADGRSRVSTAALPALAAGGKTEASLTYEVAHEGRQSLVLTVRERPGDRLVAAVGSSIAVAPLADLSVFKSFYRNDVALRYRLRIPEAAAARGRLDVDLRVVGQTRALATRTLTPALSGEVRFDTDALQAGQYELHAALLDPDGGVVLEKTLQFPQLRDPAVQSRLVTVRDDNMLIVGGKPFFPIGLYEQPSSEGYARSLADAGFNLCQAGIATRSAIARRMDCGLHTWIGVGGSMDFSTDAENKRERLAKLVADLGDEPGLLCWESIDEPAWGGQNAEGLYDGYCFLRALDQQRPIWTNHAPRNLISTLADYNRATDIAGCDIYPVPPGCGHSNLPDKSISVVGGETDKSRHSVNSEKPVFMVIQGFGWAELSRKEGALDRPKAVMPTFAESRFMAYDAIVHGANGLLYWGTHHTEKPSRFWSELRSLVSELAALQDVLAARTYDGPERAELVSESPGVQLLHKRFGNHHFIVVVNEVDEDRGVTLHLPGFTGPRLRRLFEDVTLQVDRGRVRLTLRPYGVAVLSDDETFVDQRKDFSADWRDRPSAADLAARLAEPGNSVRNGSFEVDADGDFIPDLWSVNVPLGGTLTDTQVRSGIFSLALSNDSPEAATLAVQRGVDVQGGRRYRLSAWFKTADENVEARAYCEWNIDGRFHSRCPAWVTATDQWQQVVVEFDGTPDPGGAAYAVVQMRGAGTVWFDDVLLEEIE